MNKKQERFKFECLHRTRECSSSGNCQLSRSWAFYVATICSLQQMLSYRLTNPSESTWNRSRLKIYLTLVSFGLLSVQFVTSWIWFFWVGTAAGSCPWGYTWDLTRLWGAIRVISWRGQAGAPPLLKAKPSCHSELGKMKCGLVTY